MTNYVDTFALHKKGSSAQDCMGYYMPKPPSSNPGPQAPGRDISDVLGEKQIHKDRLDGHNLHQDKVKSEKCLLTTQSECVCVRARESVCFFYLQLKF